MVSYRIWQDMQPASQLQAMCNRTRPGEARHSGLDLTAARRCNRPQWAKGRFTYEPWFSEGCVRRPTAVPFIHGHQLMLQRDHAQPLYRTEGSQRF